MVSSDVKAEIRMRSLELAAKILNEKARGESRMFEIAADFYEWAIGAACEEKEDIKDLP